MSAKPEVVGTIGEEFARVPQSVMDAVVVRMEENELEIERLKRQRAGLIARCELLQAEKNERELALSNQILSIHANYLDRITALEEAQNRTGNLLQPLVGLREEFQQLRDDHDNLSYRVPV